MEKSLRKCYECLDLQFSSTIEQVEAREKALIKIFKAKEKDEKISCKKEIEEIKIAKEKIIENIIKNGVPNDKTHHFETSNESIVALIIVCFCVGLLCYFSFSIFL